MNQYTTDEMVKRLSKIGHTMLADNPKLEVKRLPFNIPSLDTILDGGLARGRTTLVVGDFSTGKSFICFRAVKSAQEQGLSTAFIDVERAVDPEWLRVIGIKLNNLIIMRPSCGEEAWDMAIESVKLGVDLVIMDSVAALVPTSEIEEGMDHQFMGLLARLCNKGFRKITKENENSVFIIVNQPRTGIGGPVVREDLPGGRGQNFYSSVILRVNRGPFLKDPEEKKKNIGFYMRVYLSKNKLGKPLQECELPFLFENAAIDVIYGLVQMALDCDMIKQKGPYYYFGDEKWMGRQTLSDAIKADDDLRFRIEQKIRGEKSGIS